MGIPKIILLVINVVGGAAVIGSYIQGFAAHPGSGNALWGGVPLSLRSVYGISMILSALGYFAFLYYIMFCLAPAEVRIAGRFGFWLFNIIFLGILVPSAFWMPLTYSMMANPSTPTWIAVRAVLILVGISSCALLWALLSINTKEPSFPYWLAITGSIWFAFHTVILDMLLWPALFKA